MKELNVDSKHVANIIKEQSFWVGENADIEVIINLYEHNNEYKITSWLNGTEELNTENYDGPMTDDEIIKSMEKLVMDNIDYILSIANWDGE